MDSKTDLELPSACCQFHNEFLNHLPYLFTIVTTHTVGLFSFIFGKLIKQSKPVDLSLSPLLRPGSSLMLFGILALLASGIATLVYLTQYGRYFLLKLRSFFSCNQSSPSVGMKLAFITIIFMNILAGGLFTTVGIMKMNYYMANPAALNGMTRHPGLLAIIVGVNGFLFAGLFGYLYRKKYQYYFSK